MKIAIVSSLFAPYQVGGSEEVPAQLASSLSQLGHDVHIVSTCRSSDLGTLPYKREIWEGLPVWRVAANNVYWLYDSLTKSVEPSLVQRIAWHMADLWNPLMIQPLTTVFTEIKPDVLNTHNINGFSSAVWQVAASCTPAVFHTLHDFHLMCFRGLKRQEGKPCEGVCDSCKVYGQFRRAFQGCVSSLITPSRMLKEELRARGWRRPVHVVNNTAGTVVPSVPQKEDSTPLDVLFLTRLDAEKGCETLLSAIRKLEGNAAVHFHVAGRGVFERQFKELSESVSNLTWHGFVCGAQKQTLLASSDLSLQISECQENAPLSLLEAKQHGLYLLGTDIGGIPEFIEQPQGGCLIAPKRVDELCSALIRLSATRRIVRADRAKRIAAQPVYGHKEMAMEYMKVFLSGADHLSETREFDVSRSVRLSKGTPA